MSGLFCAQKTRLSFRFYSVLFSGLGNGMGRKSNRLYCQGKGLCGPCSVLAWWKERGQDVRGPAGWFAVFQPGKRLKGQNRLKGRNHLKSQSRKKIVDYSLKNMPVSI